jgi:hypothetical protein
MSPRNIFEHDFASSRPGKLPPQLSYGGNMNILAVSKFANGWQNLSGGLRQLKSLRRWQVQTAHLSSTSPQQGPRAELHRADS